ncbi:MAG TPA: DUF4235 domain-containing protein [Cellulomonas sp.]
MADEQTQSTLAKVAGLIVAGAATWAAQKAVGAVWKAAVGHQPPKAEDDGGSRLGEVVAAAAITGAVVALARVLATRGTARFSARVDANRELPKA